MGLVFDIAGGMRSMARLCLLPALLLWPLWAFLFGSAAVQFAIFCIAFFLGLISVLLTGTGLLAQGISARFVDRQVASRGVRREALSLLLAPLLWGAVVLPRVDAHVWLWWHEAELQQIVEKAKADPAADARRMGGHDIRMHDEAVLLVRNGIMQRYGVAWDPGRRLHHGQVADMSLTTVRDLRGPWRLWMEDD